MQMLVPSYLEFTLDKLTNDQHHFREQIEASFRRQAPAGRDRPKPDVRPTRGSDAQEHEDVLAGADHVQSLHRRLPGGRGSRAGARRGRPTTSKPSNATWRRCRSGWSASRRSRDASGDPRRAVGTARRPSTRRRAEHHDHTPPHPVRRPADRQPAPRQLPRRHHALRDPAGGPRLPLLRGRPARADGRAGPGDPRSHHPRGHGRLHRGRDRPRGPRHLQPEPGARPRRNSPGSSTAWPGSAG